MVTEPPGPQTALSLFPALAPPEATVPVHTPLLIVTPPQAPTPAWQPGTHGLQAFVSSANHPRGALAGRPRLQLASSPAGVLPGSAAEHGVPGPVPPAVLSSLQTGGA